MLSFAGAALGLGVAAAGVRALIAAYPDSLPRSADVSLDLGVLAFTLIIGLATGAVFGLAPLLHLAPDATSLALKEGGMRSTAGAGRNRVRRGLVVAEVALAVALVIGAGLLLRTVTNLSHVDSGFNRGQLVTFAVTLPNAVYSKPEQVRTFYMRLLADLRSEGSVQSVAAMTGLPPLRQVNANDTDIDGYVAPPEGPFANIDYYNTVTTGYVETMGIPVIEGRAFQPTDALGATVLINQAMARTFYKEQSPIGRRVRPSGPPAATPPWFTIIGVLKAVKQGGVDKKTGTELYFNFEQLTTSVPNFGVGTMNIVMRTTQPADALSGTIRAAVAGLDRSLPIARLRSVEDVFAEAGDSARGDRELRRAVLHGYRTPAGDRDPDGAGRRPRVCLADGVVAGAAAHAVRHPDRVVGGICVEPAARVAAVRGEADRSADDRGRGGPDLRGGPGGLLPAGSRGDAGGSDDCVARGIAWPGRLGHNASHRRFMLMGFIARDTTGSRNVMVVEITEPRALHDC